MMTQSQTCRQEDQFSLLQIYNYIAMLTTKEANIGVLNFWIYVQCSPAAIYATANRMDLEWKVVQS